MNASKYDLEPQPADDVESQLESDLQSLIAVGSALATCPMLPEKLRQKIGETVRAARGCSACHMPYGEWHEMTCKLGGPSLIGNYPHRRVEDFDFEVFGPHDEPPTRSLEERSF